MGDKSTFEQGNSKPTPVLILLSDTVYTCLKCWKGNMWDNTGGVQSYFQTARALGNSKGLLGQPTWPYPVCQWFVGVEPGAPDAQNGQCSHSSVLFYFPSFSHTRRNSCTTCCLKKFSHEIGDTSNAFKNLLDEGAVLQKLVKLFSNKLRLDRGLRYRGPRLDIKFVVTIIYYNLYISNSLPSALPPATIYSNAGVSNLSYAVC